MTQISKDDAVFKHPCFFGGKETRLVRLHRTSHNLWVKKHYLLAWIVRNIIRVLYICQIHPSVAIGKPVHFGHGLSMVIGRHSIIGNRVNLTHNITIAAGSKIGDNVFIGPGAVIVNPVTIGNNVRIGANATITKNVPDNTLAIGVPATYRRKK